MVAVTVLTSFVFINAQGRMQMTLKSLIKGWSGEIQGTLAKKVFLDSAIYIDVNNVTIPTPKAFSALYLVQYTNCPR